MQTLNGAVSEVVEYERRRRGWSRAQLARELVVDRAWVSNKLNGNRGWLLGDLELLAERLDVPLAGLLERIGGRYRAVFTLATKHHTRRYGARFGAGAAA